MITYLVLKNLPKSITYNILWELIGTGNNALNMQIFSSVGEVDNFAVIVFPTEADAVTGISAYERSIISSPFISLAILNKSDFSASLYQSFNHPPEVSIKYSRFAKALTINDFGYNLASDEVDKRVELQCLCIISMHEKLQNYELMIYSLFSCKIYDKPDEFCKYLIKHTLDKKNSRIAVGKIIIELLSRNLFTTETITQGINGVCDSIYSLELDQPHMVNIFSNLADTLYTLITSEMVTFDFQNLKESCTSIISTEYSDSFFLVLFGKLLDTTCTLNVSENIIWAYNKWVERGYVPINTFISYYKMQSLLNDRVGVFVLSLALNDQMVEIGKKELFEKMCQWIYITFGITSIKSPLFMRSLTIAIFLTALSPEFPLDLFFPTVFQKLMYNFINLPHLSVDKLLERQIQCLYGIQLMKNTFLDPENLTGKLFHKLFESDVLSLESLEMWINEGENDTKFFEDVYFKEETILKLNSMYLKNN